MESLSNDKTAQNRARKAIRTGGLLLFLVYYIFATVGVQLFGGLIDVHNPNLDHTGFAEAQQLGSDRDHRTD